METVSDSPAPTSFKQIIELWESRVAFAAAIGIYPILASTWWQRDMIPAEYFPEVVDACAATGNDGITLAVLHRLLSVKREDKKFGQRAKTWHG